MKVEGGRLKAEERWPIVFFLVVFLFSTVGCDAFVRKFTRKKKKQHLPQEELVLEPQDYRAPGLPNTELGRQYFLFWKSWQDELIAALSDNGSHKRQLGCLDEALKSLQNLRPLLVDEKQKLLDAALTQLAGLRAAVKNDLYGQDNRGNARQAERIRRMVLKDLPYSTLGSFIRPEQVGSP